jgi:hypothetical protein
MKTVFSIGAIALTALTLALSSVIVNQAWAAFPNPGQGHETTASKGASGNQHEGGCPGNSAGKGCAEDISAGKSGNIKVKGDCCGNSNRD